MRTCISEVLFPLTTNMYVPLCRPLCIETHKMQKKRAKRMFRRRRISATTNQQQPPLHSRHTMLLLCLALADGVGGRALGSGANAERLWININVVLIVGTRHPILRMVRFRPKRKYLTYINSASSSSHRTSSRSLHPSLSLSLLWSTVARHSHFLLSFPWFFPLLCRWGEPAEKIEFQLELVGAQIGPIYFPHTHTYKPKI